MVSLRESSHSGSFTPWLPSSLPEILSECFPIIARREMMFPRETEHPKTMIHGSF